MTAVSIEFVSKSARRLVPLAALLLASCGGPVFEFGEVEGQVTLNAKPLAGAIVRFYPLSDAKEQLPYATGVTDAAGRYALMRDGEGRGALVGRNRVVVHWPSRDMRDQRPGAPAPGPPPEIPLRYTVASDSPLTFEVKAGKQTINLPLQDQP